MRNIFERADPPARQLRSKKAGLELRYKRNCFSSARIQEANGNSWNTELWDTRWIQWCSAFPTSYCCLRHGMMDRSEGMRVPLMAGTILKKSRLPVFHLRIPQELCSLEPSLLWSMDPFQWRLMHVSPMLSYSLNLCLGGLVSPSVLAFRLLKCDTFKPQIFRSSFSFIPVTDTLSSHSEKLLSVLRKPSLQPSLASLLSLIAHWQFYSTLPCCRCARLRTDNSQHSNQ